MQLHQECCGTCILSPPAFDFCQGLFHYRSPVADLLSGFKFKARFDAGLALADLLGQRMKNYYATNPVPDVLVPVPLHINRLQTRGYNQAQEITKIVAACCGIPWSRSLLMRYRHTTPQTELKSAAQRLQNLRHAFRADNNSLKNVKHIAIIDDVVTTMATVNSAAKVLTLAGIETVEIWCVARASR